MHAAYRRWFGEGYDLVALDAVMATAAAGRLDGDPPWLLVVGGSGAAKTETITPLAGAGAVVVSTVSGEAALLSGTSHKERAKDAHGGLLRRLGSQGTLVVKDVTSILSMHRDTRAEVLAALREVYDGHWSRFVGTDGGRTLTWEGRVVVIGAVTTAWDSAHSVVATMGDRFVLVRMRNGPTIRRHAGTQALGNVSHEKAMRKELAEVVGEVIGGVGSARAPKLPAAANGAILDIADVVTRGRTAVERDFRGDPEWAHDPEMPTRFAKQLAQVVRGGLALGLGAGAALAVATRCACDSMPPLRLRVLVDVHRNPSTLTSEVVKRVQLPRTTVDRTLQELHLLGLLVVGDRPVGTSTRWAYTVDPGVGEKALKRLTEALASVTGNVTPPGKETP